MCWDTDPNHYCWCKTVLLEGKKEWGKVCGSVVQHQLSTHGALDFTLSSEPNKQKHNMQSTLIKDTNLTPFTLHLVDFAVLGVR